MLKIEGVSRSFGDRLVLDDVGFTVERGRLTGFVGGNGAGKTTTMRIILGVLARDGGTVTLDGSPVTAVDLREAAKVAKAADRPIIGFSTDSASASRGVYLLSFMIEGYIDREVEYAAQHGKHSFGALVPDNDYGNVALAEIVDPELTTVAAPLRAMGIIGVKNLITVIGGATPAREPIDRVTMAGSR